MKKSYYFLCIICVVLIALNLRAPLSVVGSIAHDIQSVWALSDAAFGALGSLPLVCFFIFSLLAAFLPRTKAMALALIVLFAGILLRSVGNAALLFIFTCAIGAAIAVLNVMMPSFIKHHFRRQIASIMALYSLTLSASSLIGVFGQYLSSWLNAREILAIWAVFALAAALAFYPFVRKRRFCGGKNNAKNFNVREFARMFKNHKAWIITAFMGLQSCVFYTVINWYLVILHERGLSKITSANAVVLFQLAAIFSAYFLPLAISKLQNRSRCCATPKSQPLAHGRNLAQKYGANALLHAVCACNVAAFCILLCGTQNVFLLFFSALLFSVPVGGIFGVALSMIATKAKSAAATVYLSAMAQSVGYLIAALGPWIFGLLGRFELGGVSFGAAILFMIIISAALWLSALKSSQIAEI